jgi:hypothetical protein
MSRSIVSTGASKGIGRAAEIAAAIAFLAGERAAFITGQTLFMMEAQAWGVCRNLLPAERILGLHIKTACPQSSYVRPLNPQIGTTI